MTVRGRRRTSRTIRQPTRGPYPAGSVRAGGHFVEHQEDVLEALALRDEPGGAGTTRGAFDPLVRVRGEDHDWKVRCRGVDPLHRLDPRDVRHRQVHEDDVRLELLRLDA